MSGDYLTKLRQKPKHVRDNIAFGVAGGITSIVALFLIVAVHGPKVVGEVSGGDNQPQLFETLIDQAKEQVAATKASMKSQTKQANSTTTNYTSTPAANGNGAPAPAILVSSSSASTSPRIVTIATTSASSSFALPADE
jgi:hypothetical protein